MERTQLLTLIEYYEERQIETNSHIDALMARNVLVVLEQSLRLLDESGPYCEDDDLCGSCGESVNWQTIY